MLDPELIVAVCFAIFVGLMIYLGVHRKINSALDGRASRIEAELAEATRLRTEAEALLASFEKRGAEALAEAEAVVAQAHAEAERIASEAHARISEFIHRRTKQAEEKISVAETQAATEVRARRRRCCDQSRGNGAQRRDARRIWRRAHQQGHHRFEDHVPVVLGPSHVESARTEAISVRSHDHYVKRKRSPRTIAVLPRIELDHEIRLHHHRIGNFRRQGNPAEFRRLLGLIDLVIIRHIAFGELFRLKYEDELARAFFDLDHIAGFHQIRRIFTLRPLILTWP